MSQVASGLVLTGMLDFYPQKTEAKWLTLDMDQAERLLGASVQTVQSKKILEALGFKVRKGKGSNIEALVPTYRLDVTVPQDLVEEIGRVIGYENIAGSLPECKLVVPQKNYTYSCARTIRNAFKEAGFLGSLLLLVRQRGRFEGIRFCESRDFVGQQSAEYRF
jgi:phenylalanyl-tRNA synthetase beta chain